MSTEAISSRLMLAGVFTLLGEFCLFGFLSTFEPGDFLRYWIIYALLVVTFFGLAIGIALGSTRGAARRFVLIGIGVGAVCAFLLPFLLLSVAPEGELPRTFGLVYGILAAPLGAMAGGAAGAGIGVQRAKDGIGDGSE